MKLFKKKLHALIGLALVGLPFYAQAGEEEIKKSFSKTMPSVEIGSITQSEISGLYEVTIGANILYVSGDGKYMLQGHLIDIEGKRDLTEEKLSGARKQALDSLGADNMITFKAKNSQHKVYIFTDIDCGYCRKLHGELDQYLAEGITIQYLFYPRAGKGSDSYNKAVAVWCADDKAKALTDAKSGKKLDMKTCANPIDKHMELGVDFEVRGTPMIVTEKGNIFPGYVPAKKLVKALAEE
ncbi:MAG: DsbC family protein [Methylococcales bacterium]|nr:DsbC family protein [Methylococcales bacterium]